jgi:lysophospholipid acyltransferase (LPLAT)-like uncharacterized protein
MAVLKRGSFRNTRLRWGGYLTGVLVNAWMARLSYRFSFVQPDVDPAIHPNVAPSIFLFWHEYIPCLFHLRPNCNISILLSKHRDAEMLAQASLANGYGVVRGSSNRGAVQAVKEIIRRDAQSSLGITPDGPRGPRRNLAPGCVYLGSRLGMSIVPIGVAYDRPWRVKRAWDQFAIPRPFTNARLVFGERIDVPVDADKETLNRYQALVAEKMAFVHSQAEAWVEGKIEMEDSIATQRSTMLSS